MMEMLPWLAVLALGLPVGIWLSLGHGRGPVEDRLALVLLPPCALLLLVFLAERIVAAPYWDWNAARLAPAFAVAQGHHIYPSLTEGTTLAYIYGPVFALAFLPATVINLPTTAILLATMLSIGYFFLPALALHVLASAERPRSVATGFLGFLALAFIVRRDGGLSYSAFSLHADAPALFLVAGACVLLLAGRVPRSTGRLIAVGFLMALAVWCKQPVAPIVLVLPLWIALTEGRREFTRSVVVFGLVGVSVSVVLLIAFGVRDLGLNMFAIPAAVPWKPGGGGRWGLLSEHLKAIARTSIPFVLMAAAGAILDHRPSTLSEARSWLRNRRWPLLFLVGLAMVPTSLLGIVKRGGGANSLSFTLFFLALAGTMALAEAARPPSRTGARISKGLLVAITGGLAAYLVVTQSGVPASGWDQLTRLPLNPQRQAHEFLLEHPGEIYFPWNPLAHLMAEGELYHFEYGVNERQLVGLRMSMEQFRAHIPPGMRYLGFQPRHQSEWTRRDYLTEFTARIEVDELPGWYIYVRADDPLARSSARRTVGPRAAGGRPLRELPAGKVIRLGEELAPAASVSDHRYQGRARRIGCPRGQPRGAVVDAPPLAADGRRDGRFDLGELVERVKPRLAADRQAEAERRRVVFAAARPALAGNEVLILIWASITTFDHHDAGIGMLLAPESPGGLQARHLFQRRAVHLAGHRPAGELRPYAVGFAVDDQQVVVNEAGGEVEGELTTSQVAGVHDARAGKRSPGRGDRRVADAVVDDLVHGQITDRVGNRFALDHQAENELVVLERGLVGGHRLRIDGNLVDVHLDVLDRTTGVSLDASTNLLLCAVLAGGSHRPAGQREHDQDGNAGELFHGDKDTSRAPDFQEKPGAAVSLETGRPEGLGGEAGGRRVECLRRRANQQTANVLAGCSITPPVRPGVSEHPAEGPPTPPRRER